MSEILNYIYLGLIGIIIFYNYSKFAYYIHRSAYDAGSIVFYLLLESLAVNIIFIIIHNFFHEITIIKGILLYSCGLIIIFVVRGFQLMSLRSND